MCDKMAPTLESVLGDEVVEKDILEGINRQCQGLLVCEVRVP